MPHKITRSSLYAILALLLVLFIGCLISKDKTTIFIIGDSTVKNGQGDGKGGLWGWGDFIRFHFDSTKINIENHALGGTSSRTFLTRQLWNSALQKVKPGDYVLIQFGHNDGGSFDKGRARASIKGIGDDSITVTLESTGEEEIIYTYGWYLRRYIRDTRSKGAIPIIITPIPRNIWDNGSVQQRKEHYPHWARLVAEEEGVACIDLNSLMAGEMNKLGELKTTGLLFFKKDHTHTTALGAKLNAKLIALALKGLPKNKLSKYVIDKPEYYFPNKSTIFLIGDSTVKNCKGEKRGWGDEFHAYIDTNRIKLVNNAKGGRSSRTFLYEGLWNKVLEMSKPGDYVLMQFGHNDAGYIDTLKMRGSLKGVSEDSLVVTRPEGKLEIVHTYGWYIRKYITDARSKGIIPIVLSPVPRSRWKNGKVERMDQSYALWSKQAAKEMDACFIDLNEYIASKYENEIGEKKVSSAYFVPDRTHTTQLGAKFNAKSLFELIRTSECIELW